MTVSPEKLDRLTAALRRSGPRRAVTRADGAAILGIHPRDVQDVIAELQKNGWPIISDCRGYWIAGPDDIPQVVKAARTRLWHAIAEMGDARRFVKIARNLRRSKQQKLFPEAA